ncbi:MAG: TRAP transporter substrate-binding protein DctP [Pseudomonadota bacterium]
MMRMSSVLALVIALASPIAGAQTQLKIATLAPQNSSWATEFTAGAKEVEQRTEGRVKLKFYWGGAQGSESKVLQKIKIGQLHGGTFSPTDFQERYPDVNIYGLPFFFESHAEVDYVRERIDSKLKTGFDELGFQTYGFAGGGFANILSNEPVRSHDDLKGKKVWLPEGDLISYEAMKALQLSPVPLPVTDVLTGLQTGLIDIVAIPPVVALALQWHTKVKYVTQVPVLYAMGFMAIDKRALRRVSDADKAVIADVMQAVYARVDGANEAESENAIRALLSVGIEDVPPKDGEFERIRSAMAATNRRMAADGMFSAELLEEIEGHVQAFRATANSTAAPPALSASDNR